MQAPNPIPKKTTMKIMYKYGRIAGAYVNNPPIINMAPIIDPIRMSKAFLP